MPGFSGLPGVIEQMEKLGVTSKLTADELKKLAEAAIKAVTEGDKAVKKQREVLTEAERTAREVARLNKEFAAQNAPMHAEAGTAIAGYPWMPWGELTKPEDQAGRTDPTLSVGYTKLLEDLVKRIREAMGPDNYIAKLLENELPYLKNGARSAGEVQNFVQGVMINLFAGLRDQLADPKTPKDTRALLEELMGLAMDARNIARESDLEGQKRAADERKRQDEIRDILATDRHNKTKAQLDDLDKRLKELQGSQEKVAQAVTASIEKSSGVTAGGTRAGPGLGTGASTGAAGGDIASSIEKATGRTVKKIEETAAEQKQASQAIMDQLGKESDETRRQMKEADDRAKKDAEETRKRLMQLGDELLHGPLVPVATPLSDELERRTLLGG